jgi:hypothetical protein
MKSKSYFVDRIIKLRGGEGDKDELMKLQMVDILRILNEERIKQPAKKAEPDDIVEMLPDEKEDNEEEKPEEPEKESDSDSDSDEENMISIVKRFLFTPGVKE